MEDAGCAAATDGLQRVKLDYFVHVPDNYGAPVVRQGQECPDVRCESVAREDEGIGIAARLAMGGKTAVPFYQDVGPGNLMVALTTLRYGLPCTHTAVFHQKGWVRRVQLGRPHLLGAFHRHGQPITLKAFVLDCRVPVEEWPLATQSAH